MLVVEHDRLTRLAVRVYLVALGYHTLLAADAQEALDIAAERVGSIDLVLADMALPATSCDQLVAELRRRQPNAKAILMASHPRQHLVEQGRLHGDSAYLEKPFHLEALAAKLREVLSGG